MSSNSEFWTVAICLVARQLTSYNANVALCNATLQLYNIRRLQLIFIQCCWNSRSPLMKPKHNWNVLRCISTIFTTSVWANITHYYVHNYTTAVCKVVERYGWKFAKITTICSLSSSYDTLIIYTDLPEISNL